MTTTSMHLLIVDDDPVLGEQLTSLLSHQGYHVTHCIDAESGLLRAQAGDINLLLLDVRLPGMSGLELLATLRQQGSLPVLMLSACGAEEERIRGLQNGADDYLAKPFNPIELNLRIEALLRRTIQQPVTQTQRLTLGALSLNQATAEINVAGSSVELTPLQFRLLWLLAQHRGQTLSKSYLYHRLFQREYSSYDRSLDMHVSRIRRKLSSAGFDAHRLQTQHGKGYCLQ
ncbi:response regulator transcription factor [Vreelandella sp. H-I2]